MSGRHDRRYARVLPLIVVRFVLDARPCERRAAGAPLAEKPLVLPVWMEGELLPRRRRRREFSRIHSAPSANRVPEGAAVTTRA